MVQWCHLLTLLGTVPLSGHRRRDEVGGRGVGVLGEGQWAQAGLIKLVQRFSEMQAQFLLLKQGF